MQNIPEELIVEILLRLPVKSLLRFRCVSKSWLSLISNPEFAKMHFQLASNHTHKLLYIAASHAKSIDLQAPFYDDSAVANLNFPFNSPAHNVAIMGSCRGFLLLKEETNLLLWNPSNGAQRQVPCTPIVSKTNVAPFLFGFGYDPSTDEYLVLLGSYDPNATSLINHFELFSMKTNTWRINIMGTEFPYVNPNDEPVAGLFLNDAIHWLASRRDEWVGVILAFDFTKRNLIEVPMPDNVHFAFCDLRLLGGCLSLSITGIDSVEIWVMKEYGVKPSWTKYIIVSVAEIQTKSFSPICFTNGGEIVGVDGCSGIVKCNDKGELVEQRNLCQEWPECKATIYTETLLGLPSP
ncbi:hypothetical protein L6164_002018 [Bauhinia variegata]|uniref:Uncharacterized protein n=1 Tax=Bauhinia variegata TaxID=167791 RepID=A0ACB9PXF8_BAUVA|nr:hypothetical protein L6164_002018 [Bauhinia variegata]